MTTTVISNYVPYGAMTNQAIGRMIALQTTMERLQDAIANAASGYEGVAGTEYEASASPMPPNAPNLFGVQPTRDRAACLCPISTTCCLPRSRPSAN